MIYLKKNKWSILIDIIATIAFLSLEATKMNYLIIVSLFGISCFFNHLRNHIELKMKLTEKSFATYERKTLMKIIEDLSSEIVYPTWNPDKKHELMNEISNLKKVVNRENAQ